MKFRRGARRAAPRKRAVWVNIPFGNVQFTEVAGNQDLLVPEDWEASFTGLTQERAVLRAIVGQIHILPTVAATAGNDIFWGIYMAGANETAVPSFTTAGMSEVTWLTTGSRIAPSVVTQSLSSYTTLNDHVEIKAKRKLDTRTKISICAQFGADTGSPAGIYGGLLRFLVARD